MTTKEKELQVKETETQDETGVEEIVPTREARTVVPRADIYETDSEIVAVADMPGVDDNAIDITLEKNVLTIYGRVEAPQLDTYGLAYAEYEASNYERRFTLSNKIDFEKIKATVKDGVLRVHLPKIGLAQPRKIAVQSA